MPIYRVITVSGSIERNNKLTSNERYTRSSQPLHQPETMRVETKPLYITSKTAMNQVQHLIMVICILFQIDDSMLYPVFSQSLPGLDLSKNQWGVTHSGTAELGALFAPAHAVGVWGRCRRGSPPPAWGSGGITPGKILNFYMQNPDFWCTLS
jgi:hypothetical protein